MQKVLPIALVLALASSLAAAAHAQKQEATAAQLRQQTIERRTVDRVIVGRVESEAEHGYKVGNEWFSYELRVDDKPLKIVCTFAGDRWPFEVFVDGRKISGELPVSRSAALSDVDYYLPEALTRNKKTITVRFQSAANASAGRLLDVRTVWADIQE